MALTQVDQGLLGTNAQYTGFKNRLINSAMVIDQRNAGASVTSGYPVDRWSTNFSVGSKFTLQRSTTAPAGFSNSVLITSSSAYSLGASDYFLFNQLIEGLNFSDFGWGTANAVPATLSFWVRASLTGTYSVQIQSGSATYVFYLTTYTVNSANTWEYKTITFPAPTSGGFPTDNSAVFSLRFTLGSGTSQTTAPTTSWQTSGVGLGATGQVNVAGTNGATFYITGVQLEKGSTATSFDYRPYGTELSLCYRYFYKWQAGTSFAKVGFGRTYSTTNGAITTYLPQPMRSTPTGSYSSLSHFDIAGLGTPTALTIPDGYSADYRVIDLNFTRSGATSGVVYQMEASNTTSAYLTWSAEL